MLFLKFIHHNMSFLGFQLSSFAFEDTLIYHAQQSCVLSLLVLVFCFHQRVSEVQLHFYFDYCPFSFVLEFFEGISRAYILIDVALHICKQLFICLGHFYVFYLVQQWLQLLNPSLQRFIFLCHVQQLVVILIIDGLCQTLNSGTKFLCVINPY